jgi:hypothetical protein
MFNRSIRAVAVLGALVATGLSYPPPSVSDEAPPPQNEKLTDVDQAIKMMRAEVGQDRRDIVAASMLLTPSEAQTFWPLYDQYRAEQHKLGDRKLQLIKDFAATRETMTEEQAEKLRKEAFAIEKQRISIKEDYASKMSKVLSARVVTRFFQIDTKLDAFIDAVLAAHVPLLK